MLYVFLFLFTFLFTCDSNAASEQSFPTLTIVRGNPAGEPVHYPMVGQFLSGSDRPITIAPDLSSGDDSGSESDRNECPFLN